MVASGRKQAKRLRAEKSGLEGTMLALDFMDPSLVLTTQAYLAYMSDLRRGRYVGTDVEKVIWAILARPENRHVERIDASFAEYLNDEHERKFPGLFSEVFRSANPLA